MKNVTVDENNEFIFRFRIPQGHQRLERSLDEFYRMQILELARIIQFHFKNERVDVDSFSFRNEPDRVIEILPPAEDQNVPQPKKTPVLQVEVEET